jgi:anti-sigma regulatory factor (Ser/Thr protein kinase)
VSASQLAKAAGVSRQTAHYHLKAAVQSGELRREGGGRSTHYLSVHTPVVAIGSLFRERYRLAGLAEDRVWQALAPALPKLADNVVDIAHYGLTELVNNAIDHSKGDVVDVDANIADGALSLDIVDDGVGVFEHVKHELVLANHFEAIEQLHKGKTTTMPDRHTGEGLFFVSKSVDLFELDSNGLRWRVDNHVDDMAILEGGRSQGTRASISLSLNSARDLRAVFDAYTDDFHFSRTKTVVRLFAYGTSFVSRSEAKRLLHGLDRFSEVELDFTGVAGVGQGFADEVFRVWQTAHPQVLLRASNMCDAVAFMVRRAQPQLK